MPLADGSPFSIRTVAMASVPQRTAVPAWHSPSGSVSMGRMTAGERGVRVVEVHDPSLIPSPPWYLRRLGFEPHSKPSWPDRLLWTRPGVALDWDLIHAST